MSTAVIRTTPGLSPRRALIPAGRIVLGIAFLAVWQWGSTVMGRRMAARPGRDAWPASGS